ncbi:MAG: hypothetical protein DMG33_15505 [Acidobacteria bacterium]|nr:MAG: hypothetical protein DMG33_15505 [Acidobacteriota bacterium]
MGTSSSLGSVTRFDSTLGYNFNHHFGVDFGAPVLFVHSSSTTTTTYRSANGIGDVYTDLRFTFRNPAVNFVSNIRGTAPTGSTANGFSSGRATADWNNHFDRAFGGVTPFADLGVANTVPDSAYFVRPYTTLGLTGHFDGGAGVRILPLVNLRASAYAIEPSGQQKVFSKLLTRQASSTGPGASSGHGVFQTAPETTGTADIARDHGFSVGFEASPFHVIDLAIGYTRSVTFSLDTVYFGVGFNLARFFGSPSH